jgi:hypothetical protein
VGDEQTLAEEYDSSQTPPTPEAVPKVEEGPIDWPLLGLKVATSVVKLVTCAAKALGAGLTAAGKQGDKLATDLDARANVRETTD